MAVKHQRQYLTDNDPSNFDNGFGGSNITNPYDGSRPYLPFEQIDDGSGGGSTYTPPVPPNNTFVPPSTAQDLLNGNIVINLLAESVTTSQKIDVEFFENDISRGIGTTSKVIYSPAISFGDRKIYKAFSSGKVLTNYYEVYVVKSFIDTGYRYYAPTDIWNPGIDGVVRTPTDFVSRPQFSQNQYTGTYDFNFDFNRGNYNTPLTRNDQLYTENLEVLEYTLQDDGTYIVSNTQQYKSSGDVFNLTFYFREKRAVDDSPLINLLPVNTISQTDYEISFATNFGLELNGKISLEYVIENASGDTIDTGIISIEDGAVLKPINYDQLINGKVRIGIVGQLPLEYKYDAIYRNKLAGLSSNRPTDFVGWTSVPTQFELPIDELKYGIVVVAELYKEIDILAPTITIPQTKFDVKVKESDLEKGIRIPFTTERADNVIAYINRDKSIQVAAADGELTLYFQKDFEEIYGSKKVLFVADSNRYGTSSPIEIFITFTAINDFPSIIEVSYPQSIDVPSFSDLNIEYKVVYDSFAATSVDVDLRKNDGTLINLFKNLAPNADFKINVKKINELHPYWDKGDGNLILILRPYNRGGAEDLIGNEYEVLTKIQIPVIQLDETIIEAALMQVFTEKVALIEPDRESKYLTHLLNFGDNEQLLISSWEEDSWTLSEKIENEDGVLGVVDGKAVQSLILKLYTPLPANIVVNSTSWITKLMTNPLVETVVLMEETSLKCPPIKGPNFNIEVNFVQGQSTGFESLDDVLLSGSTTNSQLTQTYVNNPLIDWKDLNIEYATGSNPLTGYLWQNFIHYSSAKERLDNFVYKVQLIETYETLIVSASSNYSGGGAAYTGSQSGIFEIQRQNDKKNALIQSFDGFENFLYTSSSLSWPYNGTVRYASTSSQVINWYASASIASNQYDQNNANYVVNNIPQYILNYPDNEQYLLFLSMIGHHFDIIYFYAKSIENTRNLGYKTTNGISDKLLFDILKSYSWDPKNLNSNIQLWEYTLGLDDNGDSKFLNPTKQRNYEVWRRILNNLPYLLKHKGTKRGIYALLACYGVPSSNLSIMEFGGPESSDSIKGKMVMDMLSNVLNMVTGSSISLPWVTTENSRTPDTLEITFKPTYSTTASVLASNGWSLSVSASNYTDSNLGKLIWNYGAGTLTSNEFPIYGENYTSVALSKQNSNVILNIAQYAGERAVFTQSLSTAGTWAASTGTVTIGSSTFNGLLDEIRMWSTPLSASAFLEHAAFPEMINGNHFSSSTDDLFLRLDFEYPKNLNSHTFLLNVDANVYYDSGYNRNDVEVSASPASYINSKNAASPLVVNISGFDDISTYPYQFEIIERSVVAPTPSIGSSRFVGNKVRIEEQTLISNLSPKYRSTIKSYDQSPIDSNRVGVFFSPTKELNLDIIKSFGGLNFDNYIGDPSDKYSDKYTSLNKLRNYYFQRYSNTVTNIYEYINLIKLYEKSMFDDIKQMLPARSKITSGLLIEPHILERSKYQHIKPEGDTNDYADTIDLTNLPAIIVDNNQHEVELDTTEFYNLTSENLQYDTVINADYSESLTADSFGLTSEINTEDLFKVSSLNEPGYLESADSVVDTNLDEGTPQTERQAFGNLNTIGQDELSNVGFGVYGESGYAIRSYFNASGTVSKERVLVSVLKEKKQIPFTYYVQGDDPRSGELQGIETYYETRVNVQPFYIPGTTTPSTFPSTNDTIVSVTPVNGYLSTHYRYTGDLTTGLQNSYSRGCRNTASTTLDGTPPVEVFATNPNTLKVNKAGRDASEPILETE